MSEELYVTNNPDIKRYVRAETVQNCEDCGKKGFHSIFVDDTTTGAQRVKVLCKSHWYKIVDEAFETYV